AQQACGESTCAQGTVCQTVSSTCPAIDCVGPDCRPCEPTETSYCAPAPCTLDSECGPDQVCAEETYTECAGETAPAPAPTEPACPPGAECSAVPDAAPAVDPEKRAPSCTTKTTHHCTP